MSRYSGTAAVLFLLIAFLWFEPIILAQQAKVAGTPGAGSGLSPDKALTLAEQGHCQESISALKRAMTGQVPAETRKRAGIAGLRCSLTMDNRDVALDFLRLLGKQFPQDPDVLFIVVHAYSDLSTRAAQDLGRTAPQSIPAHKLNAEALEMQGKWEPAQLEYEGMIEKEPNASGIHFLLGRLLLSRPDAGPDAAERAKQEFLKELKVDPSNAGAQYVLGELARRDDKWDEAISRFSQAAKLDSNFAEAYLSWGECLVTVKRYEDATPPLRVAERLAPGNPAVHHALATALERSGHREEAEKEFAIHRSLVSASPMAPDTEKPQ
jgi:tetratricopeptide (TPR) repeat protein